MFYRILWNWGNKTAPLTYTWRHKVACRISKRFAQEYEAALDRFAESFFPFGSKIRPDFAAGTLDCSKIQAGFVSTQRIEFKGKTK